ncbi:hypothetical protein BWI17_12390 [Betaproteobacteria bacterium GR16-43]|nr:hypothetical protein BWI17_12390 [Betaproteobacteria bacterium GR16-43]
MLVFVLGLASFPAFGGDRLLVTGGAQQLEGQGGGGLVPWALIAGYGTRDQVGGSAFATRVETQDFKTDSYGIAMGLFDRLELSVAKQAFDASSVVPGLKLHMDTFGAKVKVFGDALYEQDSPWPQVSLGAQYKKNHDMDVPRAVGAKRDSDTDLYVAATKVWLGGAWGRNVVANLTLRSTRANQLGFLGFGGDANDSRELQAEGSVAVMLSDQVVVGAEYRAKPDNLSAFKEDAFSDAFVAWFPNKYVAITAAYANLGSVAGKGGQRGAYLSVQLTY